MRSPLHLLLLSVAFIFIAESLVMYVIATQDTLSLFLEVVLDATALVVIVFPILYFLHYRQLQKSYDEIKQSNKRLQLADIVFRESNEAIMISDEKNRILKINPAFTEITGYTLDEIKGKNPKILSSGQHDKDFYLTLWQSLSEKGNWSGEIWNRRKNGEVYPEWLSINVIRDDHGNIINHQAIFSDITSRKQEEARLLQLANYDALTGLPNRLLFHDRLRQAREVACRDMKSFAVLFVDLDYFKEVNDGFGHAAGDAVLQTVAKRLQSCVRTTDTVSRYGGDEFLVILQDINSYQEITIIVEKIIDTVSQIINISDKSVNISASVGISLRNAEQACSARNDGELSSVIEQADKMMYEAKQAGRSTYKLATHATNDPM